MARGMPVSDPGTGTVIRPEARPATGRAEAADRPKAPRTVTVKRVAPKEGELPPESREIANVSVLVNRPAWGEEIENAKRRGLEDLGFETAPASPPAEQSKAEKILAILTDKIGEDKMAELLGESLGSGAVKPQDPTMSIADLPAPGVPKQAQQASEEIPQDLIEKEIEHLVEKLSAEAAGEPIQTTSTVIVCPKCGASFEHEKGPSEDITCPSCGEIIKVGMNVEHDVLAQPEREAHVPAVRIPYPPTTFQMQKRPGSLVYKSEAQTDDAVSGESVAGPLMTCRTCAVSFRVPPGVEAGRSVRCPECGTVQPVGTTKSAGADSNQEEVFSMKQCPKCGQPLWTKQAQEGEAEEYYCESCGAISFAGSGQEKRAEEFARKEPEFSSRQESYPKGRSIPEGQREEQWPGAGDVAVPTNAPPDHRGPAGEIPRSAGASTQPAPTGKDPKIPVSAPTLPSSSGKNNQQRGQWDGGPIKVAQIIPVLKEAADKPDESFWVLSQNGEAFYKVAANQAYPGVLDEVYWDHELRKDPQGRTHLAVFLSPEYGATLAEQAEKHPDRLGSQIPGNFIEKGPRMEKEAQVPLAEAEKPDDIENVEEPPPPPLSVSEQPMEESDLNSKIEDLIDRAKAEGIELDISMHVKGAAEKAKIAQQGTLPGAPEKEDVPSEGAGSANENAQAEEPGTDEGAGEGTDEGAGNEKKKKMSPELEDTLVDYLAPLVVEDQYTIDEIKTELEDIFTDDTAIAAFKSTLDRRTAEIQKSPEAEANADENEPEGEEEDKGKGKEEPKTEHAPESQELSVQDLLQRKSSAENDETDKGKDEDKDKSDEDAEGTLNPPKEISDELSSDEGDNKLLISDFLVEMLAADCATGMFTVDEVIDGLTDTFTDDEATSAFVAALNEAVDTYGENPSAKSEEGEPEEEKKDEGEHADEAESAKALQAARHAEEPPKKAAATDDPVKLAGMVDRLTQERAIRIRVHRARDVADMMSRAGMIPGVQDFLKRAEADGVPMSVDEAKERALQALADQTERLARLDDDAYEMVKQSAARALQAIETHSDEREHVAADTPSEEEGIPKAAAAVFVPDDGDEVMAQSPAAADGEAGRRRLISDNPDLTRRAMEAAKALRQM